MSDEIPRTPWLLSTQYGMDFVISQDNEIILGDKTCKYLGRQTCQLIVDAVNEKLVKDVKK